MQIDYIICPDDIEEKLARKHHVTLRETRQALLNNPKSVLRKKVMLMAKMYTLHLAKPLADDIYRCSSCSNQMKTQ